MGLLDGAARGGARLRAGARDRVDRRRRRWADARADPAAARTSSARRSCAGSTRCCRRRGRSSTRSRGWTRCPRSAGPRRTSPRRCRRSRTRPAWRRASRSVVRVVGTACGLAIEGSGWVAATGRRGHQRPRRRRRDRHERARSGGSSPSLPAEPIAFDPQRRPRGAARARTRACRRSRFAASIASGTPRRDPRLSRERPVRRAAGPHRAHADGGHPERLRSGARVAAADAAARARATGQLGRPAGGRRRAGADDGVRGDRRQPACTAATAWPTRPSRACCAKPTRTARRRAGEHGGVHQRVSRRLSAGYAERSRAGRPLR